MLWKIIADNLQETWLEFGAGSQPWIPRGGTVWIADAHRDDGEHFVVRADEEPTAFVELESAIHLARSGRPMAPEAMRDI